MNICYLNPSCYDYLHATLIEGLLLLGHKVICSEDSNYGKAISDSVFRDALKSADLTIVSSPSIGTRYELLEGASPEKMVFVDSADFGSLGLPQSLLFKAAFKRELVVTDALAQNPKVFPLPFAAERRYFQKPEETRQIQISFLANLNTNPLRYSIHHRLLALRNPNIISGFTGERAYSPSQPRSAPIPTPNYQTLLHSSKISVSVPGAGYDCARFWEILAAGAMLMSWKIDTAMPNPFEDGKNCVMFSSLDEFGDKLNFYLKNLSATESIAQMGVRHLLKYHTTRARAEYFLSCAHRAFIAKDFLEV